MGEVWKARDTRLERSEAIKVLPAEFAQNAQLRLRFEREAKSISQLNHPHICTLYDVGNDNGVEYLVLEYIEGETLADRLQKGPLPLDQVLRYGIEIAEALDRAHKAGIVHRDLKPGNIMITKSGAKLLDFGLAKPAIVASSTVTPEDATVAAMVGGRRTANGGPLTDAGTIVGTFQYLAPEQIEGVDVDARTDIFALGAVLYEMATGKRAFDGKSKASLIANILGAEPQPISAMLPTTPPALDRLVRTCLSKDPDQRWQSAHDVAIELRSVADARPVVPARSRIRERMAWAAALVATAAALALGYAVTHRAARRLPSIEAAVPLPPHWDARAPSISPDGTNIAFSATKDTGETALIVRNVATGATTTLDVHNTAPGVSWSRDSRSIPYRDGSTIRSIALAGGTPQTVAVLKSGTTRGLTWGSRGTILVGMETGEIDRVAQGGTLEPVVRADRAHGETSVRFPSFLPDGEHFLYLSGRLDPSNAFVICVGSIDGKMRRDLFASDTHGVYADGYILFVRDGKLLARAFDAARFEVTGDPHTIADDIGFVTKGFPAFFSVSTNGLLLYRHGDALGTSSALLWYDRSGKQVGTVAPENEYFDLSLSRDGRYVAVQSAQQESTARRIWIFDVARNVSTLLTGGDSAATDATPVWMPDGHSILFVSGDITLDVYRKPLDGEAVPLLRNGARKYVCDVSSDGSTAIIATVVSPSRSYLLGALSLRTGALTPIGPQKSSRWNAKLSPDNHWIAYACNDTERPEIYISPYPDARLMTRLSTNGGRMPYWSADGRKLYYAAADLRSIYEVDLKQTGNGIEPGQPRELFKVNIKTSENTQFVVTRDDQRFLVNAVTTDTFAQPFTLLTNWTSRISQ